MPPWIDAPARPEWMRARAAQAQPTADAGATRWWEIRNAAAPDEAEILLYDEVGGWFGATADAFVAELSSISAPGIRVRINSPGGSVFDGIAIANALRQHPATVTVQVDGIAASIASVIAMAGDRVVMMPQSQLMIHDASAVCIGNASDMAEMAALLDKQSVNISQVYAARTGGTPEEWRARMQAESWYLADEAVAAGLADEVVTVVPRSDADPDADDDPDAVPDDASALVARQLSVWDLSVFRYAGRAEAPAPVASAVVPVTAADGDDDPPPEAPLEPVTPADPPDPEEPEAVPDSWAALTAHLTAPEPDPWSALTAHLTLSPGAATA